MVTAYDAPSAALADAAGIDIVLVGDSAGTTVLGLDSTVAVTMDEMLVFTRAAARGDPAGTGRRRHAVGFVSDVRSRRRSRTPFGSSRKAAPMR